MDNNKKSFVLGLVPIIIAVGVVVAQHSSKTKTVGPVAPATSTGATYTITDVAKHKTSSDCWTTINGNVYDVTSWISKHPGGAKAIVSLCGIDGSAAFNGQHGGEKRPVTELVGYKIGVLK